MLYGFHRARAYQRRADEAQSDWFEFPRWEIGCGITGPESVAISRDDRKARDLRIAHEVVDLLALGVGSSEVVAIGHPVSVRRPRVLDRPGGEVLHVHAVVQGPERIPPNLPGRRRSP